MDQTTIDGCLAKVERAEKLTIALENEWRAFLDEKPWPSRIEHDADSGWYAVYVDFTTPPPPVFGVIVGELAHDLRSALDHLVWRESVEGMKREPTRNEERAITFPFAWKETDLRSAQVLRYVNEDAAALVERYQPYACTNSREAASLGVIPWFNNLDKHRALHITAASAPDMFQSDQVFIGKRLDVKIAQVAPHLPPNQRMRGDTKVVSFRIVPDGRDPQVSVQGDPPVTPGFGDLPTHLHGAAIPVSIQMVRQVVEDFANLIR